MSEDFQIALVELSNLGESVLLEMQFDPLFRSVTLWIDRVLDPRTGILIEDPAARVLEIELGRCTSVAISNELGEGMWGPEANWGLNEMAAVEAKAVGDQWQLDLVWETDRRRFTFHCHRIDWRILSAEAAKKRLRAFWGDDAA